MRRQSGCVKSRAERGRTLPELALQIWVFAVGVTLFAGIVKGVIGFAMPLIMVSGLTTVLEPRLAVAGIIIPVVISNGMQTFRRGFAPAIAAMRDYWRYLVVVCAAIAVFAQLVPRIDPQVFYLIIGVPVVALSVIQLLGVQFHIPPRSRWWAEWLAGLISGVLGGLAGMWGPTTVLYLLAVDTAKERQIVVQGVIYGVGAVTLLFAHLRSGILNGDTAPFSAALLLPALFGMWLGFRIQDRLDQAAFRKATLAVLVIAGLNLIRRGLFG